MAEELAATGTAEGWDCVPCERTLRHWARKGNWPAVAAAALRSLIPDLTERTAMDLLMGAAEGMPYLREVVAGRVAQPNSTRIRAILTGSPIRPTLWVGTRYASGTRRESVWSA